MKMGLVTLNLFSQDQDIFIIENGNVIQHLKSEMAKLPEVICQLNDEYTLDNVTLDGALSYATEIQNDCLELNKTEYHLHPLTIDIMMGGWT